MKKFLPMKQLTIDNGQMSNVRGFTLVELLVVVSIIAILSAIGIVIFTGIQKSARDARRTSDIDAIAAALETTYRLGFYQTVSNTNFSSGKLPNDPINVDPFQYSFATAANSDGPGGTVNPITTATATVGASNTKYFIVCAKVENTSSGNSSDKTAITPASPPATTSTYYCKRSQQ